MSDAFFSLVKRVKQLFNLDVPNRQCAYRHWISTEMSASDYECSRFYLDENRLSGDLTSRWSATECAGGQVYEMPIWTSGLSNCTSPRMNLCRALIQTRGLEALSRHCELAYCLLALRVFAAQRDRLIAGKKHPRAIGQHNEAIRPAVQGKHSWR